MLSDNLSRQIDRLSVVARQCIAALCFERYCELHSLRGPDFAAFFEHLWRVGKIEGPDGFFEWEQGFQTLDAAGWGEPLSESFLQTIPHALRDEYSKLACFVIETSATTWYGSDMEGTKEYLLRVIDIVSRYGIQLPDLSLFESSSPNQFDGWGSNPSPDELYSWRHAS